VLLLAFSRLIIFWQHGILSFFNGGVVLPFDFQLPTKIYFGPGKINLIAKYIKPIGKKPLIVAGKSSMRRLGILDKVTELLKKGGIESVVFEGIEPNPRHTTCDKAAALARKEGCDMIIGLGGGSAMDAAKGIAITAKTGYSVWDYVYTSPDKPQKRITEALPIVLIPTVAATGSEADSGGVISNWETKEKTGIWGEALFPKASIVDPELTFSCPPDYTADGGIDIISHVLESYFTGTSESYLQDRFSESVIRTVINYLPRAIENGNDLEARTHLSWCSTVALSGFINSGRGGSYPLHALEHVVSAHYDISHGRGLALLLPALMDFTMPARPEKYAELGENVFGLRNDRKDIQSAARAGIEAMKKWLASIDRLLTFRNLGIDDSKFEAMADDVVRLYMRDKDYLVNARPINRVGVLEIFRKTL
jgi:alcohol dehydrogenase YqhD (iron-dependent ADH family)